MYALEGSIFNAGTIVQWMRDELSFFEKAGEIETLASNAKNDITFYTSIYWIRSPILEI
jgi:glycerol kinase